MFYVGIQWPSIAISFFFFLLESEFCKILKINTPHEFTHRVLSTVIRILILELSVFKKQTKKYDCSDITESLEPLGSSVLICHNIDVWCITRNKYMY